MEKHIGERIKEYRELKGLSQQELADRVGYKSRASITMIEKERDMPLKRIIPIAEALGVEPAVLMGWDEVDYNVVVKDNTMVLIESMNLSKENKLAVLKYAQYLKSQEVDNS